MRFIKLTFECFGILVTHNHENITKELEQILFKESFVVIALFLKNSCKITKKGSHALVIKWTFESCGTSVKHIHESIAEEWEPILF